MKKIVLILAALFCITSLWAQSIFNENFSSGTNPVNWQFSRNTDVHHYSRPSGCLADMGVQTPAVGKDAPSRFILPLLTYNASMNIISLSFKLFVFDANLDCSYLVNTFPCPTFVTAMLVKNNYTGGTNNLPDEVDIYIKQSYQLTNANGVNIINFNGLNIIPNGAEYRIYFDFKTAENTNCTGEGIKFIFDDFLVTESENIPLPVSLSSFSADKNKSTATLKWSTQLESNSKGFFVQRNTGEGWEDRTFVFSAADKGNSNSLITYSYNDPNSFSGISQYRLVQVDLDGSKTYSNIKLVRGEDIAAGAMQAYPNPSSSGTMNILLPDISGSYKLILFDVAGRKLKEWEKVNGNIFTLSSLRSGIYFLQVTDIINAKTNSLRVLITR